jgi:hypothetical protein
MAMISGTGTTWQKWLPRWSTGEGFNYHSFSSLVSGPAMRMLVVADWKCWCCSWLWMHTGKLAVTRCLYKKVKYIFLRVVQGAEHVCWKCQPSTVALVFGTDFFLFIWPVWAYIENSKNGKELTTCLLIMSCVAYFFSPPHTQKDEPGKK